MLRDHLRTTFARHLDALTALPRTGVGLGGAVSSGKVGRAIGLVASLPITLLGFVLVVGMWAVFLVRGVCYPLVGADHLDQSWGGPTLAGAWFVHFIQGPPLLYLVGVVLRPLSWARRQLSKDIQVDVGGPKPTEGLV